MKQQPSNTQRVRRGENAVEHGCPDQSEPERERAIDTVANVLHWLASKGEEDPAAILNSAAAHFLSETDSAEDGDEMAERRRIAKELEANGWSAVAEDVREIGVAATRSRVESMDDPDVMGEALEILDAVEIRNGHRRV